jgi:5-formyltetrahydrofolate cyclo-ligase
LASKTDITVTAPISTPANNTPSNKQLSSVSYKSQLRRQLRQKRRNLSHQQQQQAAYAIDRIIAQSGLIAASRSIALYIANDGEINPAALLDRLLNLRIKCFLPVIRRSGKLAFVRYRRGDRLQPNHFGIAEPTKRKRLRQGWSISTVFMPLVGFDRQGRRLGMGGGFYDRSFSRQGSANNQSPRLIGLAHQCQEVDTIIREAWDIPLAWIVTDKEIIKAN